MNKLVSVIIITHNRPNLFKKALNSVLQQTYKNYEIIVIDGSDILDVEKFIKKNKNIKYYKSKKTNANILRNKGIELSSGDLIAFLDDDDTWEKQKIQKQVLLFQKNDIALCYTGKNIINNKGKVIKYSYKKPKFKSIAFSILWDNFIGTTSSIMIDRNIINEYILFDESLPALQDYDLFIQICQKFKVMGINEPLINYYYKHNLNQISEVKSNFDLASKIIRQKYAYIPFGYFLYFGLWQQKLKRSIKKIYE